MSVFKLVTYNIRKGKGPSGRESVDMARIGQALQGQRVDVLLCQEVFHCARTGNSQSNGLEEALGLSAYYGANKQRTVGHHGNTTLTHLPVDHSKNHDISTNPIERRGVLHLRTQLEGRALHLFNVHLGLNGYQRATQLTRIGGLIAKECAPEDAIVLAGDFNDWRQQLEKRVTEELGLVNAIAGGPAQAPRTWHARRPMLPLDRIYLRNLHVQRSGCLSGPPWQELSDHLPLFAELSLTGPSSA